jgi:hypothetical protein
MHPSKAKIFAGLPGKETALKSLHKICTGHKISHNYTVPTPSVSPAEN